MVSEYRWSQEEQFTIHFERYLYLTGTSNQVEVLHDDGSNIIVFVWVLLFDGY